MALCTSGGERVLQISTLFLLSLREPKTSQRMVSSSPVTSKVFRKKKLGNWSSEGSWRPLNVSRRIWSIHWTVLNMQPSKLSNYPKQNERLSLNSSINHKQIQIFYKTLKKFNLIASTINSSQKILPVLRFIIPASFLISCRALSWVV